MNLVAIGLRLVQMECFATSKAEVGEMDNTGGLKLVGQDENHDQLSVVEHNSDAACRMNSELLVFERAA